jgi:hypothetical protein
LNRFEPSIFKKIVKSQSGKYWFLSAFKIGGRGLLFLCAVGIFFLMILGRGCTYQAHDYIGENLSAYETSVFKVKAVNNKFGQSKYADAFYLEGCIYLKSVSYCDERIRGDSLAKIYKRNSSYEALAQAKIGDQFDVLFNTEAHKGKYQRNEGVRVIHTDIELHKSNARLASLIGWGYIIWPLFCFFLVIWQIPVRERKMKTRKN